MAQIRAGLVELAGPDGSDWAGDGLSEELIGMLEARERLDAEIITTAAQWRRKPAWEADRALSPVAWLTHRAPISAREARRLVTSVRVIGDAPGLGKGPGGRGYHHGPRRRVGYGHVGPAPGPPHLSIKPC